MPGPSLRYARDISRSIDEIVNEKSFSGDVPSATEKGFRQVGT